MMQRTYLVRTWMRGAALAAVLGAGVSTTLTAQVSGAFFGHEFLALIETRVPRNRSSTVGNGLEGGTAPVGSPG